MGKRILLILSCLAVIINATSAYAVIGNTQGYVSYLTYNYNLTNYRYSYVLSQPFDILPSGFVTIIIGGVTYYYSKGVFYQKNIREQKYLVVPPPIGAVIYEIPESYRMLVIEGVSYYEYNGIYYRRVLEGYKVVEPPVTIL